VEPTVLTRAAEIAAHLRREYPFATVEDSALTFHALMVLWLINARTMGMPLDELLTQTCAQWNQLNTVMAPLAEDILLKLQTQGQVS
jgi:hypothetical protein